MQLIHKAEYLSAHRTEVGKWPAEALALNLKLLCALYVPRGALPAHTHDSLTPPAYVVLTTQALNIINILDMLLRQEKL